MFGFVSLWKAIEALDNKVEDALQASMLIDMSRTLERGTTWFLRSRRLAEDMARRSPNSPRASRRWRRGCPHARHRGPRAGARCRIRGQGRAGGPRARAVTLDALYSTLDIVEVAGATSRPVELVAEIYFELSTRARAALAGRDDREPSRRSALADARQAAMDDELSGLQRAIASEVLAGAGDEIAWRDELLAAGRSAMRADRSAPAADRRAARGAVGGCSDAVGRVARAAQSGPRSCSAGIRLFASGQELEAARRRATVGDVRVGESVGPLAGSRLARGLAASRARREREETAHRRRSRGRSPSGAASSRMRQRGAIELAAADAEHGLGQAARARARRRTSARPPRRRRRSRAVA